MAAAVGRVIEVEDPREVKYLTRSFGRARVEIDIDKPLVPGFLAPRPDDLEDVWIQVKYEKLIRFCFCCGRLGHESRSCEEEEMVFEMVGGSRSYDASLCAKAGRQVELPMARREGKVTKGKEGMLGGNIGYDELKGKKVIGGGCTFLGECSKKAVVDVRRKGVGELAGVVIDCTVEQAGGTKTRGIKDGPDFKESNERFLGWTSGAHKEVNLGRVEDVKRVAMGRGGCGMIRGAKAWALRKGVSGDVMGLDKVGFGGCLKGPDEIGDLVGVLSDSLRGIKLKRSAVEEWDSPVAKRRKYHDWDSPSSAEKRGTAVAELERIAETDGSKLFGVFRFEGTLSFSLGCGSEVSNGDGRGKKKAKRALFIEEIQEKEDFIGGGSDPLAAGFGREAVREDSDSKGIGCGGCPETATRKP